jgi:hypothetical protein
MRDFQRSLRSLTHEIVAETIDGNALRRACTGKTKILLNIGCGKLGCSCGAAAVGVTAGAGAL